jgi:MFS family permease
MDRAAAVPLSRNQVPLAALLAGNVVSSIGNLFTTIAVPWFVLQTTGSAAKAGIAGAVTALSFVASFFGGTLVDRLGFKRVAVGGDLASGLAVALVPLLYHTVGLAFWQLLALVFLRAVCNTPGNTARLGLLPDLIALAGASKERVNGLYQATLNGATLVGTALTGVFIALIGTSNVLWLDAASFLFSATVVGLAVPAAAGPATPALRPAYWRELAEGWHFLIRDRLQLATTTLATLVNFIGAALFGVILPVYAQQVYGTAVALGALFAGASAGTLIGSVGYTATALRLSRHHVFLAGVALLSAVFWLLAPFPALGIAVVAVSLRGLGTGLIAPIFGVVSQERVPAALRGRVFGTGQALATLAVPLGTLLAGYGVGLAGLRGALIGMGAFTLAVCAWAATSRALRELGAITAA